DAARALRVASDFSVPTDRLDNFADCRAHIVVTSLAHFASTLALAASDSAPHPLLILLSKKGVLPMSDTTTAGVTEKKAPAKTYPAKAYSARSATSGLAAASIQRRAPQPQDVQIQVLYCGVCHSDLHAVRNEWENMMPTVYPCVPGHEIVGRVVRVGT